MIDPRNNAKNIFIEGEFFTAFHANKLEELRYICLRGDKIPSLLTLDEYVSDMIELQSPVSTERLAKDWHAERPIYYRLID